jgi:putative ABC transport system permease protein
MWGHYLLSLYRSLIRHRLYAALNVLGLAVGITVFLVLSLLVRFETSFDRWLPNADSIYRFNATYTFPGRPPESMSFTSAGVLPVLLADYPQIAAGTRVLRTRQPVISGPLINNEHVNFVDPSFFKVLDLPFAAGDASVALASPNNVVVSQAIASKYFGTTAVLGRTLTLVYNGTPRLYRISGVLHDLPDNTHLSLDILAPFSAFVLDDPRLGATQWGAPSTWTYVRFRSPADARAVAAELPQFVKRRGHDDTLGAALTHILHLSLTAVPALHFADLEVGGAPKPGVDRRLVYSLGAVGALTLLIAVLNYVNLATARSALRGKEIALRKVMGATRRALMGQLLFEAFGFALVAVLIGVALTELALPVVNALDASSLKLTYWGADSILPWALGLAIAIGLGAGFYPALLLSRFEPAPVLASARTPGGGRPEARVRAVLIGAQFVVAIAFTIGALVIASQAQFLRTGDRGFQRQGLILVDSFQAPELGNRRQTILDALRQAPGVTSVTTSVEEPGLGREIIANIRRPGVGAGAISMDGDVIGDDYLRTYGAKLIAGRMLDRAHGLDDMSGLDPSTARGVNLMLNARATRLLGFSTPAAAVGHQIEQDQGDGTVVGVLDDLHFASPQSPAAGIVYHYRSRLDGSATAAIRYRGVGEAEIMARLRAVWRRQAPMIPFEAKTADERLSDFYVSDERSARLFSVGAVVAVAIGCVGLYGLAAFNTARRFKEIGIRKTLGASTFDVLKLLLAQILRPVLIANLVAWPLTYVAMHAWLAGFDQRIGLNPLFFIAASLLAVAVAGLTVVAQSLRLARSEPAIALHNE